MKSSAFTLSLNFLLISIIISVPAKAQVEFEVTADYFNKYIDRGHNLDDESVFQPGLSAKYKNFTAGIWGSLELTDENGNSNDFTEIHYFVDYSCDVPEIESLGFSVGAIYYDFPNTQCEATTELYWGLSYDCLLNPAVTFYHDIDEVEGLYISGSISHKVENIFELCHDVPVGLELGSHLGWGNSRANKICWGVDDSAFTDLAFSAGLLFEVYKWTIRPSANYIMLASDDIENTGADDDIFFFGICLSKKF